MNKYHIGYRNEKIEIIDFCDERSKEGGFLWIYRCDCGSIKKIRSGNVKRTRSCGCSNNITHGQNRKGRRSAEYQCWDSMKQRCQNPKQRYYYNYGGRGVVVCKRWSESFEAFFQDMGPKPTLKHTIDRVNNNGNYEPSNCRWATRTEQNLNKRLQTPKCLCEKASCKTCYARKWGRITRARKQASKVIRPDPG